MRFSPLVLLCNFMFTVLISISVLYFFNWVEDICILDYTNNGEKVCKPVCAPGSNTFGLPGMDFCHRWLNCEDLKKLKKELFLEGVVKRIFKAQWKSYEILISEAASLDLQLDFEHHIKMLKLFTHSQFVVQAVGFCENRQVATEFHPLGSSLNVQSLPDDVNLRFKLCLSYVQILMFLHNHPAGTRVMCDSSSLAKTLSQYLLTNDLNLVIADLDALPSVTPTQGIVCGHRELEGDFVAPEQRWIFDFPFNESLMTSYNEMSDIWKIPDVCDWFLGETHEADILRFHLFSVHKKCKEVDPRLRPSSTKVFQEYQKINLDLTNK